ncbi:ER membrane protein complex subunit 7 homolog [Ochlerotatus camptorhynchus]|uniref:ER membrane protein complex subunit 7 homolog n=1 Tax=Ochlerotatus camptorhynchus TaxID=644619 RepID=UPI0031E0925A
MFGKFFFVPLLAIISLIGATAADSAIDDFDESGRYTIEGKVYPPELFGGSDLTWQIDTHISINAGEYKGFLKDDGSFVISSVPSGSYVVEILNPDYYYESVRVEINPKGKFRARKLNYVQPSQVVQVPYPLKLKALTRFRYFQQREQWKITDFLFNPMVLMMILPLFIMLILPKMMSDPETKKEMENLNLSKMTNDMPEISEMITSFFTGGAPAAAGAVKDKEKSKSAASKQSKKKN